MNQSITYTKWVFEEEPSKTFPGAVFHLRAESARQWNKPRMPDDAYFRFI